MVDGTSRNAVTRMSRAGGALHAGTIAISVALATMACSSEDDGSSIGNGGNSGAGGGGGGAAGSFNTGGGSSGSGGSTAGTGGGGGAGGAGTGGTGGTLAAPCGASIEGLGECGVTSVGAQLKRPNMLIVLDRSGSTDNTPTGFSTTIWNGLKTALATALDSVKDRANFGLELYPFPINPSVPIPIECTTNCCELPTDANINVPVEDGMTAVPKIIDALNATGPGGGTPTAAALRRALAYYQGAGSLLTGDKFVLLATDGAPNCNAAASCDAAHCTVNIDGLCNSMNSCCAATPAACLDDADTIAAINELQAAGIKTFVVGVPGTENYAQYLNQFAQAGGVPNTNGTESYYKVDAAGGVEGLTATFQTITTQLVTSCEIPLEQPPPDPTKVNVAIDCVVLPSEGSDGTGVNGWDLVQATDGTNTIVIQGTSCDYVSGGVQRVDVILGCPMITIR